jgi:hypothetical protein
VNRRKSPIDEVPAFPITANPEDTTVITLTYEGDFIQERGSEESLGRENTEEKTESGWAEASRRFEDKRNDRVRYRCVRGGDPSIVPAFGLLLVLGCAVLVDRREGWVLQVSGASRADDCNIDQQGLSSYGECDVREHLPEGAMLIGVGLPHKGLQLQWTVGVGLAEQLAQKVPNVVVAEGPGSSVGRTVDGVELSPGTVRTLYVHRTFRLFSYISG